MGAICPRLLALLLALALASGCAAGFGRAGAPGGGLWADATRSFGEDALEALPPVYVRIDDEPPPPGRQSASGVLGGVRVGYGGGRFGDLAFASGFSYEPHVELVHARPPFALSLSGSYLVQRAEYAGGFSDGYEAPAATLTASLALSSWSALRVGAGVLIAGRLRAGSRDDVGLFGQARAWGGRGLAGIELCVFRGRLLALGLRLDLEYSRTGRATIRGTPASLERLAGVGELYLTAF